MGATNNQSHPESSGQLLTHIVIVQVLIRGWNLERSLRHICGLRLLT